MARKGNAAANEDSLPRKRGRKPKEQPVTVRKVTEVFLGEFSLEDHMMKEAMQEAIKFRNSLH